ncbi:hypothetical protein HMPREF0972_01772 [Actinomyces sp. oral taxon 848 str. F0332]|nr:hypothetical protein HMPREF0972_01772 [Actinomyces sp. oral taxon 848 str. F0332]
MSENSRVELTRLREYSISEAPPRRSGLLGTVRPANVKRTRLF